MIRPTNPRAKWPALPGKAAKSDRVVLRDASPSSPYLRLNPTAWAKLLYLRDLGDTEVGGFGISAVDDLLNVEDVQLVRQTCTWPPSLLTTSRWPTSSTGRSMPGFSPISQAGFGPIPIPVPAAPKPDG